LLFQDTQNREAKAVNLKLDELIHGLREPHPGLADLAELSVEELEELEKSFRRSRSSPGDSIKEFIKKIEPKSGDRKDKVPP
jgi:low affinity Fe/Cu permease